MTLPLATDTPESPALTPPALAPSPPEPVRFPLAWLLDNASAPIQYRALSEVAELPELATQLRFLPSTHRPALLLSLLQGSDGSWNNRMLTLPSARADNFEGVGTINAVNRLLEYAWDRDTPPLVHARRILFRLLAEDHDPGWLFELGGKAAVADDDLASRGRAILREAAAATLARAGYQNDPRLRGAARRILGRISDYLASPLAAKPFVRMGNRHVLPPEAAPPSIYALTLFAHMPLFRLEHFTAMDLIYQQLSQTLPRQEAVQLCGKKVVAQPHLMLGDMLAHRNAADQDVVWAVWWLELMARLGFLRRNEGWCKLFERLLDERDASGVWHPRKGTAPLRTTNQFIWWYYPLEATLDGEERWADMTFRLGLIARLSGRPIELT